MRALRVLPILLLVASCASTSIVSEWKDPNAATAHFGRVLVVAPSRDTAVRRSAEDELVRRLGPDRAAPSYTVLRDNELGDRALLKRRAMELGFDGLLVFRIARVEHEATWVPGTYWGPYYAIGGWPAWDPGYVATNTVVSVETDVYNVLDDRLVWASRSRTYDPRSMRSLVDDVSKAVSNAMHKQGLL
jgi:hypothetical protein